MFEPFEGDIRNFQRFLKRRKILFFRELVEFGLDFLDELLHVLEHLFVGAWAMDFFCEVLPVIQGFFELVAFPLPVPAMIFGLIVVVGD